MFMAAAGGRGIRPGLFRGEIQRCFLSWDLPLLAELSPNLEGINFLTVAHLARYLEPALFGDLNMDGRKGFLDVKDLMRCLGAFGVGPFATPAPGSWNPLADLDPDGVIDYKDLFLLFQSR